MTKSRLFSALAFATFIAACACAKSPATGTGSSGGPGPGGPTGDDVPPGTVDVSKLGASCEDGQRCEAGSCAKYYGIAGPSGPEFASCEISCVNGKGCPAGTACITIADGPGQVCRPAEPDRPVD